ncbi:MAG: DUF1289 domain-containing protein [Maritimibacter sp.]
MSDDVWSRDEVQSPCTKICVIHPEERLCTGCLRSIEEISAWGLMSVEQRRDLLAALPARAPRLQKRRGGRAAKLARAAKKS